jgi:hypothetical protein
MADQLMALRRQAPFDCQLIDVDGDESLRSRFGQRVPVLESAEGRLLCEVYLDPTRVLNYLRDV